MSDAKRMTRAEFEAEGVRRFGADKKLWKFVCPMCETVTGVMEWFHAGAKESQVAFSCIGRYIPKEKSQRAFGKKKIVKGKPCDYTLGGLFRLPGMIVTEDDGDEGYWFDFAEA